MKYWSRNDTKEWIIQLEHRLEDIEYYLHRTIDWCEEYGVDDERTVFICSFLTCVWVSQMRGEDITYLELMEILGIPNLESTEEKIFELDQAYANLDHYELLQQIVDKFDPNTF